MCNAKNKVKKIGKRVMALLLTGIVMLGFSACSLKDIKKDEKKTTNAVYKIGDSINSGKFVLEGEIYSFPMRYSELEERGWKIGNNYTNVKTFQLNPNEKADGFEMNLSGNKNSIIVGVYNDTDEVCGVEDCIVDYLMINVEKINSTFPCNVNANSTASDILELYGEGDYSYDSDTTMDRIYCFSGENDWISKVELRVTLIEKVKKPFLSACYSIDWEKIDEEETADTNGFKADNNEYCENFIDSTMNISYYGDFTNYKDAGYDSKDEAGELYNDIMTYYGTGLMSFVDLNSDYVSQEYIDRFNEIGKTVLKKSKWNIKKVDCKEDEISGTVTIEMYPTNYLSIIQDDVDDAIAKYQEKYKNADFDNMGDDELSESENYYAELLLDKIEPLAAKANTLSVSETRTYNLDKDSVISEDDWNDIDRTIMDFE